MSSGRFLYFACKPREDGFLPLPGHHSIIYEVVRLLVVDNAIFTAISMLCLNFIENSGSLQGGMVGGETPFITVQGQNNYFAHIYVHEGDVEISSTPLVGHHKRIFQIAGDEAKCDTCKMLISTGSFYIVLLPSHRGVALCPLWNGNVYRKKFTLVIFALVIWSKSDRIPLVRF